MKRQRKFTLINCRLNRYNYCHNADLLLATLCSAVFTWLKSETKIRVLTQCFCVWNRCLQHKSALQLETKKKKQVQTRITCSSCTPCIGRVFFNSLRATLCFVACQASSWYFTLSLLNFHALGWSGLNPVIDRPSQKHPTRTAKEKSSCSLTMKMEPTLY